MNTGLVSVMMPAHNACRYIGEAIRSVLAQTYPHWELLVVNDGSTDGTAGVVAQFNDRRIRLFNKSKGGESSARNMAHDHARGEFVAFLDADDLFLPEHLAATVAFLDANPGRDAVYTDGFHIDEDGHHLVTLQTRRRGPFQGRIYEQVVLASDVFGPPVCVVLKHDTVARHHLRYDPRIVIGPDWDFFVRYAALGEFGYLDTRSVLYRVHGSNITCQVNAVGRAASLAICRENAITSPGFDDCSIETRAAVFYDLLLNLLVGQPARQEAVVGWTQFCELTSREQARLLRLMAAANLLEYGADELTGIWLRRARRLNPADRRATLLATLYWINPGICRAVLRARSSFRGSRQSVPPFADFRSARAS